jgi:hypothetical protein
MDALAKRQLDEPKSDTTWLYLDGHVSVYSGKHRLRRTSCGVPASAAAPVGHGHWVNQPQGEPLLVITGTHRKGWCVRCR